MCPFIITKKLKKIIYKLGYYNNSNGSFQSNVH